MVGLRIPLLLPPVLLVLLWVGYMSLGRGDGSPAWLAALALLVVLIALMAVNLEVFVLRPLRRLTSAAGELARSGRWRGQPHAGGDLGQMALQLGRVAARMDARETQLQQESERRVSLEAALRELQERYSFAVERANDGMWEWELHSGQVNFSPRWKAMLGYTDKGRGRIEDWKALLHPDDREAVLMRLENHLQGLTPHFSADLRLRHADGLYRWVHTRGTALRHANGKPYRLIVMDNSIHERKELEETLIQAAEGLSSVSGKDFFQALMRNLSSILGTRDNLVCHCLGEPPTRARTLAYFHKGRFCDNFEYELAGTSCGDVIARGEIVYAPSGVCEIWPLERQYNRESYLGVPMFDSNGKIIGHFACMDDKPMRHDLPHLAIFKIFSVRAAAELERTLLKQKLDAS